MVSIFKYVGVLSCGALLCLGLSRAAQAGNVTLTGDNMAGQAEREGGQGGLRGDRDQLHGDYTTGGERYGGQAGVRGDRDKLYGGYTSGSGRDDGQAGLRSDQDTLQAGHTTKSDRDGEQAGLKSDHDAQ